MCNCIHKGTYAHARLPPTLQIFRYLIITSTDTVLVVIQVPKNSRHIFKRLRTSLHARSLAGKDTSTHRHPSMIPHTPPHPPEFNVVRQHLLAACRTANIECEGCGESAPQRAGLFPASTVKLSSVTDVLGA